jgi:hypothetical protein
MRYQLYHGGSLFSLVKNLRQTLRSRERGEIRHNRVVAHRRLLIAELAARCSLSDQGQPPVALKQLVPKYLARVPLDPFSSRPLIYHPQGTNWLLYSVGQDGVDDGGKPVSKGLSGKGDIFFDSPW